MSFVNRAQHSASRPHGSLRIPILGPILEGIRAMRRWASRSDWGCRILRRRPEPQDDGDGLILIQIDGLPRRQLEIALKNGTMPFLRRLIASEHYNLQSFYSGIPSTTAAVQAELFYGVRSAVPAHAFGDRGQSRIVTMLDSEQAREVERRLATKNPGLLEGGSAYSNIYCGGAAHPHFCASAMGWGDLFRDVHPIRVLALAAMHFEMVLRIIGQAFVELGLAIGDCFRGLTQWKEFREAVKFLPSRVGVAVVLRELITIAAGVDAAAGVPVIQLNYLGYDERAHRRGPDSRFAHWTLRGIDRCIRHIWKAASHSSRRHYQVWIYSDHGQERVVPFDTKTGKLITDVVQQSFRFCLPGGEATDSGRVRCRVCNEATRDTSTSTAVDEGGNVSAEGEEITVAAIGPLGHIYMPSSARAFSSREQLESACRTLVMEGQIPAVLMAGEPGEAVAFTADGRFILPADAADLLGKDHPFLQTAAEDLVCVCHHPDAGDVVILGWRAGSEPLSFVFERGAHGGIGLQETGAFALLPKHTPLDTAEAGFARPEELREAALRVLGRSERRPRRNPRPEFGDIRVMTYNVHSCMGLDGRLSISRIAHVLAHCDADVIALQELDVQNSRTGFSDQALELAQRLGMKAHFHPALSLATEHYGDAVLSRLPMRLVRAAALPTDPAGRRAEPRGALWVAIDCGDWELQLINTHLGLRPLERLAQVEELLGPNWWGNPRCRGPAVLCGDFNAVPTSLAYRRMTQTIRDAQRCVKGFRPRHTWWSPFPMLRIDHVFVSEELQVAAINVPVSSMIRAASDHLPLVIDLVVTIPGQQPDKRSSPVTGRAR